MKLYTLNNVVFDIPDLFNCCKDDEQPEKFYLIGQDVRIFELKSAPDSSDGARFRIEFIKIPKARPTKENVSNNNMLKMYEKSNILNRQTLAIDPLYAAEFSEGNIEPLARHICWPKKNVFKKNVLAVVTNFGQCEIVELNKMTRTYDKKIVSMNNLIKDLFPNEITENFNTLNKIIEDKVITSCCWIHNEDAVLLFSTISGWIFAASISEIWATRLLFKIKTNFYKINRLKHFQFLNEDNKLCHGVLISDINGLISLYELRENQIIELCILWSKKDKMCSKQFNIDFDEKSKELIVSTVKACHFLIFVVSVKNWSILYKRNEFCCAQISNFQAIPNYGYVVSTIIGQTKLIKLLKSDKIYSLTCMQIPNDLEIENYTVSGMINSKNNIIYIFVMCPEKNFLLSKQRHATFISICTLDDFHPIEILEKYDRKHDDGKKMIDCYESIRLRLIKNVTDSNFYLYSCSPFLIDWSFIHKLRIRYNIIYNIIAYNIKKTKSSNVSYETELNSIKLIINAIFAYWRLLRIKKDFENFSDFQKLSAKCLRKVLMNFLSNETLKNTAYEHVNTALADLSKNLIEFFKPFCENIVEICNFCSKNTDEKNGDCLHDIGRCCISNVQISSLEMKYCEGCGDIAIIDEELLQQVMIDEFDMRCPVCDYYLVCDFQ